MGVEVSSSKNFLHIEKLFFKLKHDLAVRNMKQSATEAIRKKSEFFQVERNLYEPLVTSPDS